MNNADILKAVQCLIGSNCLVSTPEAFYVGPKGYDSKGSLEKEVQKNSEDIQTINAELENKVDKDNLKTINGNSIIGKGNISITTESGVVDLSSYLTIEKAASQYATKEASQNSASAAVKIANTYTDNKIANLDPQHVNITNDYKEFRNQNNVGRLIYLTEETAIAFKFTSKNGNVIFTNIYTPGTSAETITNIKAYFDQYLTQEIVFAGYDSFGDISFTDYNPSNVIPFVSTYGIEFTFVETVKYTTGLYYLAEVGAPIMVASEDHITKSNSYLSKTEALAEYQSKTVLKYSEGVSFYNIKNYTGKYIVKYDNYYQGVFFYDIAEIIKYGDYIFINGIVKVDVYGNVTINPNNYINDVYKQSGSKWIRVEDSDLLMFKDSLESQVQGVRLDINEVRTNFQQYHVISNIDDLELSNIKVGDNIELLEALNIPNHSYHIWKSSDGCILYTDPFDLGEDAVQVSSVYEDRYFGRALEDVFNYDIIKMQKCISSDTYSRGTVYYYDKTIDQSINDLSNSVILLTSSGYRKVINL